MMMAQNLTTMIHCGVFSSFLIVETREGIAARAASHTDQLVKNKVVGLESPPREPIWSVSVRIVAMTATAVQMHLITSFSVGFLFIFYLLPDYIPSERNCHSPVMMQVWADICAKVYF